MRLQQICLRDQSKKFKLPRQSIVATRTREHLSPESWTPNPCRYFYTLNTTPYLETVTLWWSLWWSTGPIKGNCRRRLSIEGHYHVEIELDVIKTLRTGSIFLQYCRLQKNAPRRQAPLYVVQTGTSYLLTLHWDLVA